MVVSSLFLVMSVGTEPALGRWKGALRIAGWAGLASVALTCVQVWIFVQWPPPDTVEEIYALLNRNPILGLVSLDLLYIVNNLLVLLLYLGLFLTLWAISRSAATIGMLLGSIGMAAYFASNTAFEMLRLAGAYATADATAQVSLVGAGEALLAVLEGTAFDTYYVLSAIALFAFGWAMYRSVEFTRATAVAGLAAAVLMLVPSTVATVGPFFALASLLPWVVFAWMSGRRLLRFASTDGLGPAT
jgi:hypothetical protein